MYIIAVLCVSMNEYSYNDRVQDSAVILLLNSVAYTTKMSISCYPIKYMKTDRKMALIFLVKVTTRYMFMMALQLKLSYPLYNLYVQIILTIGIIFIQCTGIYYYIHGRKTGGVGGVGGVATPPPPEFWKGGFKPP